jgi:hypothetical protein
MGSDYADAYVRGAHAILSDEVKDQRIKLERVAEIRATLRQDLQTYERCKDPEFLKIACEDALEKLKWV